MADDEKRPPTASDAGTASRVRRADKDRLVLEFTIEDLMQELIRDPGLRAPIAACNGCNNCSKD